ncbi:MAG: glycerol-3-phosphate dehydrogenase/oxidase [Methanobacteriota archaeon]|nr:MAG: glycerol-3-phosphate dehydrogenase/oxidase [Euryarchaeota archaeon]
MDFQLEETLPDRETIVKRMKDRVYDVVVIGGGVTGAGIFRDAMLRGLNVALVEKDDFASGTSSESSKLLHGGLRYLMNFEFKLVREAALERKIVADMTPHFSTVMPFVIPLYSWTKQKPWMVRMGLWLYDLLAFPKRIGKHRMMKREELIERFPVVNNEDIVKGAYYFDTRTNDSRLVLANILDGLAGHGDALNYAELVHWKRVEEGILLEIHDKETGEKFEVKTRIMVNATGPWADFTEDLDDEFDGSIRVRRTKGVHLTVKPKLKDHCILLANTDDRPIFVMPWGEYDIVGTTDTDWKGKPEDVVADKSDIDYVLDALNRLFPDANYSYEDIYSTFAGVRPLVYQPGKDERKTSREHTIKDYGDVISIAGGKLTTYRLMAQQIVDRVIRNLGLRKIKCMTAKLPLWGGDYEPWGDFTEFVAETKSHFMKTYGLAEREVEILIHYYGSSIELVEKVIKEDPQLAKPLVQGLPFIRAMAVVAARYEQARHMEDFMRRRIQIAFCKGNGLEALDDVADLMGNELGWSNERKEKEKEAYLSYVREKMWKP